MYFQVGEVATLIATADASQLNKLLVRLGDVAEIADYLEEAF